MIFRDREDAGRQLAEKLTRFADNPVIFGIPRGGVVVAAVIAKTLNAPLDIVIPRKIGAPGNPELAIGAVGGHQTILLNDQLISQLGISQEYINMSAYQEREEIKRREILYKKDLKEHDIRGRTAILVDDGLATGFTAKAALIELRDKNPAKIILAVPVAPPETLKSITTFADETICLNAPADFYAIGQFYEQFDQVSDGQVIELMKEANLNL